MTAFQIRTLQPDDAVQLLHFEQANRHWFERHVEPRGDAFYSLEGVADHIREFLAAHADGTRHPCVIVDGQGAIVGRANLKEIDRLAGTAEVGYRIAASHVGMGLASRAVGHLVDVARVSWQLKHLHAFVAGTRHRPASCRKAGSCQAFHMNSAALRTTRRCSAMRFRWTVPRASYSKRCNQHDCF